MKNDISVWFYIASIIFMLSFTFGVFLSSLDDPIFIFKILPLLITDVFGMLFLIIVKIT